MEWMNPDHEKPEPCEDVLIYHLDEDSWEKGYLSRERGALCWMSEETGRIGPADGMTRWARVDNPDLAAELLGTQDD
jgi:hypothetical protein